MTKQKGTPRKGNRQHGELPAKEQQGGFTRQHEQSNPSQNQPSSNLNPGHEGSTQQSNLYNNPSMEQQSDS